ncbi:hypothetical protein PVL29_021040 [Vitis rotundifolia]|uniref:MULE transposase domain-containing protein n=1 Tax=Vitis rotundifolia TaxID=103349 RepID=A0AA38YYF0_VITRO|nr:hypothetical protein PVL29_021040 [Vitis rotundifolia]
MSIHGFQMGCWPILSIDSSHMSGPYKGALFSASSYDADDDMFPLAYGLFSSKNYEDWLWFLEKLKMVIGEREVIIISDRHQGIICSVSEVFGSENHAHCYQHIKENFSSFLTKKDVSWDLRSLGSGAINKKGDSDHLFLFLLAMVFERWLALLASSSFLALPISLRELSTKFINLFHHILG